MTSLVRKTLHPVGDPDGLGVLVLGLEQRGQVLGQRGHAVDAVLQRPHQGALRGRELARRVEVLGVAHQAAGLAGQGADALAELGRVLAARVVQDLAQLLPLLGRLGDDRRDVVEVRGVGVLQLAALAVAHDQGDDEDEDRGEGDRQRQPRARLLEDRDPAAARGRRRRGRRASPTGAAGCPAGGARAIRPRSGTSAAAGPARRRRRRSRGRRRPAAGGRTRRACSRGAPRRCRPRRRGARRRTARRGAARARPGGAGGRSGAGPPSRGRAARAAGRPCPAGRRRTRPWPYLRVGRREMGLGTGLWGRARGGRGGTRTPKLMRALDPEPSVSTNSTTRPGILPRPGYHGASAAPASPGRAGKAAEMVEDPHP